MDRRDFMDSIMVDNLEECVYNHFDQIMALYDLVGNYECVNITPNYRDQYIINFNILLSSGESIHCLKDAVDSTKLTVYNKRYNIQSQINNNNSLFIQLEEIAA